jgi:hypothetical protein
MAAREQRVVTRGIGAVQRDSRGTYASRPGGYPLRRWHRVASPGRYGNRMSRGDERTRPFGPLSVSRSRRVDYRLNDGQAAVMTRRPIVNAADPKPERLRVAPK